MIPIIADFQSSPMLLAVLLLSLALSLPRLVRTLHLLQLDSYSNSRLLRLLAGQPRYFVDVRSAIPLLLLTSAEVLRRFVALPWGPGASLAAWALIGSGLLVVALVKRQPQKKPLVYTGRAVRLLLSAILLTGMAEFAILWLVRLCVTAFMSDVEALVGLLTSLVVIQVSPLLLVATNSLLSPIQAAINVRYVRRATERLADVRPVVIGITGSYGKTSTKFFLEVLLRPRYRVLKTPASFNTLLGIARAINDELRDSTEVLIAEMGAYQQGDIRELASFVRPTVGILTAIGPQHLERFKTLDAIEATKAELIEALPSDGLAIVNGDDPRCRRIAARHSLRGLRVKLFGLDNSRRDLALWATELSSGPEGLRFMLVDQQGRRHRVQTSLLGRHNVSNILAATLAATDLGLPVATVVDAIKELRAAPHRLQLSSAHDGLVVIDDSYNSNPVGAAAALDVLREFQGGNKVLVTPGMVELGEEQGAENTALGEKAAAVCDFVVLVGRRQTEPLRLGLARAGFPEDHIRVVRNLDEARTEVETIAAKGPAVVLFENDLPDLYDES